MPVVLVADGSERDRHLLVALLGEAGHRTVEADDLGSALQAVRAEAPDLVVTDILLPGMDGYEFVHRLRADRGIEQPRVVFSTANYLAAPAQELAAACGVSRVVTKPAKPELILDAVIDALGTDVELPAPPPDGFDREHLRLVSRKLVQKIEELEVANRERNRLVADLVRAQESERTRIAAAVHDDSIQMMAAVCLRLEMLGNDLTDPVGREAVAAIAEKVGRAVGRLRRLVFDLSPRGAQSVGLAAGIEAYLREVSSEAGFEWRVQGEPVAELPDDVETILYRIAQEATRNAQKHAKAKSVTIELRPRDRGTLMRITDNGLGFRPEAVEEERRPGHVGMLSMRERVALVGGTFRIDSAPGEGCTVEVWVPDVGTEPLT